jgi:hypothetical protein
VDTRVGVRKENSVPRVRFLKEKLGRERKWMKEWPEVRKDGKVGKVSAGGEDLGVRLFLSHMALDHIGSINLSPIMK